MIRRGKLTNQPRRPANKAEGACFDLLTAQGYEVQKRGWPDFIAWKDGKPLIVEVKPKSNSKLKIQQHRIMKYLSSMGVDCCRWDPDKGYRRL